MLRRFIRKISGEFFRNYGRKEIPYSDNIKNGVLFLEEYGICLLKINKFHNKLNLLIENACNFLDNFSINNYQMNTVNDFKTVKEIISLANAKKKSICINRNTSYYYSSEKNNYSSIDNNFFDFFEPQFLNESIHAIIEEFKTYYLKELLQELNINLDKKYKFSHASLYCYRGNTSPRWIHYDSFSSQIKIFIALNNLNEISIGPYCYVIGSHKNNFLKIGNTFFNKLFGSDVGIDYRDGSFLSKSFATPAFMKKYEILISDNTGYHGDLPSLKANSIKNLVVINLLKEKI